MNPQAWRLRLRLPLALASGGLLLLAFPPPDVRWAAWVALVPLTLALREASARAGALLGFAAGLTFFGPLLYWLMPFGVVAWLPLVLLMAGAWALAGWFGAWASRTLAGRLLGVPLLFTAADMLRSRWPFGGFAWGLLGTTQHSGRPLLPLARVGGVFLVGLTIFAINAAIAEVVCRSGLYRRALVALGAAALGLAPALLPMGLAGPAGGSLNIAAIQVNVREGTFGPTRGRQLGDVGLHIIEQFVGRTADLGADPPDVVVWPENALDRDPLSDENARVRLIGAARSVGRPLVVGAIVDAGPKKFRNSLLFVSPSGDVVGRYDKQHLVPFGEYVPWPSLRRHISALTQVPFDGVPGSGTVLFDVGGIKLGGVVCFESIFPDLVRGVTSDGAGVLVVATNNASFGRTTASAEHLAQSQLRAVEEGRTVVHAAISGISAVVGPDGSVRDQTALFTDATLRAHVTAARGLTIYARYGAVIETAFASLALVTALAGSLAMIGRRRERLERAAAGEFEWQAEQDAEAIQ